MPKLALEPRALGVSRICAEPHLAPALLLQIQAVHQWVCIWEVIGLHERIEEGVLVLPESNAVHITLVRWTRACGGHPAPCMRLEVKDGDSPAILFFFLRSSNLPLQSPASTGRVYSKFHARYIDIINHAH